MSRDRKRRRVFAVVAVLIAVGAMAYIAAGGIGGNLVYYWSPSELNDAGREAVGASVRLGGLVEAGSINRSDDGLTLEFAVTDGAQSVAVSTEAVPPAMFREGIGVVVEGTLREDGTFETRRLMVKHDNQYQAPGEGEQYEVEELVKTMQFDKT